VFALAGRWFTLIPTNKSPCPPPFLPRNSIACFQFSYKCDHEAWFSLSAFPGWIASASRNSVVGRKCGLFQLWYFIRDGRANSAPTQLIKGQTNNSSWNLFWMNGKSCLGTSTVFQRRETRFREKFRRGAILENPVSHDGVLCGRRETGLLRRYQLRRRYRKPGFWRLLKLPP